jgi:anti-sigma factor RsiW
LAPTAAPAAAPHARAVCAATLAQGDALVDAELPPAAAAALEGHLRACAPCRAHVAALREVVAAVRRQRAHATPAPASLRARARAIAARWHAEDARAHEAGAPDDAPGADAGDAAPGPAGPRPAR